MLADKILVTLFVWFYSLLALVPSCHSGSNAALGKPYTVSVQPNYPLTASPADAGLLVDGKYTVGHFWTQKSTVGWQNQKAIEILIDLKEQTGIGSISFSTARGGDGDVNYPRHIAAYVGPDTEHLQYVGDLADAAGNESGPYQLKKFVKDGIELAGRYVLLVVVPKGYYLFSDEIEISASAAAKKGTGNLTAAQARVHAEGVRKTGVEKDMLTKLAHDLDRLATGSGAKQRSGTLVARLRALNSAGDADSLLNELYSSRREILAPRFPGVPVLIEEAKPWSSLSPISSSVTVAKSLTLTSPEGGYDIGAVAVTNLTPEARRVSVGLDAPLVGATVAIEEVPVVKSAGLDYVADPLVPLTGAIVLRPGESRVVFIRALGIKRGKWHSRLVVKNGEQLTSLPVTVEVAGVALPKAFSLNSNTWGYLDFNMLQSRRDPAVRDLLEHHTNVVVVPPKYLPTSDPVRAEDFQRLQSYLENFKGTAKVLLYADFRTGSRATVNGTYPFMGPEWREWFRRWYAAIAAATARAGISSTQLYFYPYDEMDPVKTQEFISFASWVQAELPSVQLYATINNRDALKSLPYLDIAQIEDREELLKSSGPAKGAIWMYSARGPGKSLSPYTYYRLMAWKAFAAGYQGIGFWSYADAGWGKDAGSAWDDFDGSYPDYAVIYEGKGDTIVSSRRWEAWRMGMEDHQLLVMYAGARGEKAAKALAEEVLAAPEDSSRADRVRRRILAELTRNK